MPFSEESHEPRNFASTGLPTNVVITGNNSPYNVGDTPTLTCEVTGGNPTTSSFSWSKGGTIISGAMGNMLSLSSLASVDNNQDITCTATNVVGSVTSAASTLNVLCEYYCSNRKRLK